MPNVVVQPSAALKIVDHKLVGSRFQASPNHGGTLVRPLIILVHYTGGVSLAGAVTTLCDGRVWLPPKKPGDPLVKNKRRSSAIVIGQTGEIVQLVPFNQVAWHAGESVWKGKTQVNLFSIGIELDNAGPLKQDEHGQWHHDANKSVIYPEARVLVAKHKSGGLARGWLRYTPQQLESLDRVTLALREHYPTIVDGAGHEDVSPGRKFDPGPAFPMEQWRAKHFRAAA